MIQSFEDAEALLRTYIPPRGHFRDNYTLDTMQAIMRALGNPQNTYEVVHVAGTSGKTSTSYYIASMLKAAGKKVGLTVSPHIDQINERIQINLKPLDEPAYCAALTTFIQKINKLSVKPTYFELLVAFAFWEFARQKVDYAVIEVGLGGLLDATNVISNPRKVCVITDIGFDHMHILGHTYEAIATQKVGIIQHSNEVFCLPQNDEVAGVLQKRTDEKSARLHVAKSLDSRAAGLPAFQQRNWSLAASVYDYLAERDLLPRLTAEQLIQTMQTYIPGRIETIKLVGKTIVMDGAHNSQKMEALVKSLQLLFPGKKFAVILGLGKTDDDKTAEILNRLLPLVQTICVVEFYGEQDYKKRSIKQESIMKIAQDMGYKNIEGKSNLNDAFRWLLTQPGDYCLISGSFYLLNKIRPLVFGYNRDND